jgi:ATP-dependent RNA helicase RhlE
MGIAKTGTGKTGAFLIPLIHRLVEGARFQTLVMVPTRELACQVEDEFKSMAHGLGLYSACFIGGTNLDRDVQKLKRHSHLVVGTPGRLLDLLDRGALHLDQFGVLILDEFDRMLDMGFVRDVQRIVKAMTGRRQTMLFSATVDSTQQHLIDNMLRNPKVVKVSNGGATGDHIAQEVIRVREGDEKYNTLLDMIRQDDFEKVLVFAETKGWVKRLHKKLVASGIKADLIHGDKTQNTRQRALDEFKQGRVQVLVATDVAARGLDVSDVTHVINYQLPRTYDSYIHRIGRTGRAGKGGKAYTFVE